MYNLILVDDEVRALSAIRNSVSWEEMNVQVIGCFDNALSALELMINEHVDILVTDIKMPVMDGLELIGRAKEMYPDIKCLVISGYEEFELARSAIAHGVRGYLLKPCEQETLEASIRQCIESIEKEKAAKSCKIEQRQEQVERIYEDLMSLKLADDIKDVEMVRQVASRYQDFSMVREAIMMAFIHHEQSLQELQVIAKKLIHIQDMETMIQCAVGLLRKISKHTSITDPVVLKMVNYVYEHYDVASLTLQDVADNEIHLSSRYIGRKFVKVMNMKFSDFLTKVRMDKAIELLHESDYYTADEIANQVGLGNNVRYFYRLFREHTGMTVKEYRDKITRE